jgi:hypothetical protein
VAAAADRGIYAYARQDTTESIQSAIEVAMRRWREHQDLGEQVERLETALERRALIERAKGIIMERHSLEARPAFDLIRDHARSHNRNRGASSAGSNRSISRRSTSNRNTSSSPNAMSTRARVNASPTIRTTPDITSAES